MSIGQYPGGAGMGGGNNGSGGGGGQGGGNRRNRYVALEELQAPVQQQMQAFKSEVASELGLQNYNYMDKGELTSRQNGYVGGNMTKKMVSYAELAIAQNGAQVVAATALVNEIPARIRAMNEAASQGMAPGIIAAPPQQGGFQTMGIQ